MASTLRCMSLWLLLLLLIIGVLSPLAAETSNKISRVKRKTCQISCSTANFESEAVTVCYELDPQECCRVCEKGQYRIDNGCQYNNDTHELQFNCEWCGTGTYQGGFNVKSQCDQCPLPSVSCQQGEVLSEDCDKYSGEYKCRPKKPVNTSTTEPYSGSVITSENPPTGTAGSTNSDDNNNIGKIVGGVVGGLLLVVIVIVAYVLCKKVNSTNEPKPYLRVSCNQPSGSDENGLIEIAIPDDSSNYVLKDGKEYFEFESHLAIVLPPDGSKLKDFFQHLRPMLKDCEVTNIMHNHKGDVCEGKRQLLKSWTEKVGKTKNIRVQLLLSGMRKVDGLQECRRQIIEKYCCLNSENSLTNTNE